MELKNLRNETERDWNTQVTLAAAATLDMKFFEGGLAVANCTLLQRALDIIDEALQSVKSETIEGILRAKLAKSVAQELRRQSIQIALKMR